MTKFFNTSFCATVLFVIVISLMSQYLFSGLGFNPTDDGFILAYSRRLLDGQVPHRDFISIRPAGSALLHLPFVAWGGDKVFWYSRLFVWFELACIAWIWVVVLARILRISLGNIGKVCLASIAFALSANTFPIMAWHTIDGIFFVSFGLALIVRRAASWQQLLGYFLMGLAYLCKQNFLIVAPVAIILFGDWKKISSWVAALMPGIIYVSIILFSGGIGEMINQLTVPNSLFEAGFFRYFVKYAFPWGILTGYFGAILFHERFIFLSDKIRSVLSLVAIIGITAGAALGLVFQGRFVYADQPAFMIFGLAVGITLHSFIAILRGSNREGLKNFMPQTLVLLLAWAASLSLGGTTPALLTGPLVIFCILNIWPKSQTPTSQNYISRPILLLILVVLSSLTLAGFIVGRHKYIYRESSASSLVKSLDGVFPGAQGIKTNPNTFALLTDLKQVIQDVTSTNYSIIPDFAGYWVQSSISNPLPIDWPIDNELAKPRLFNRVTNVLLGNRGNNTIIIEKYDIASVPTGILIALDQNSNAVVTFVKQNFNLVGETKYFEVYK